MRWEKLTVMSQEAFREAQAKAGALGHQEIGPEQSLLGFFVPAAPRRWNRHFAPGQRFSVDLTRHDNETWEINWLSRLKDD